jgi:Transcriptional regulator, AbiEi antitoxin/Protein of unknown function (DUF559)
MQFAGLSASAVRSRVEAGRLQRIHQGVYAVGHKQLTLKGWWMAAVLACGDGAALSYRSGAHLHDLRRTGRSKIDVTSPKGRSRRAIQVHRGALAPEDVTVVEGIPVTSVARTLLDLGDILDARNLRRAVEQADRRDILDVTELRHTLDRAAGRRGTGVLADILATYEHDATLTRTELERLFLDICREANIPAPLVNQTVDGDEVDFHWPEYRLIVETDGHDTHHTREAFERDRLSDQRHAATGWLTIRFTYRQITDRPHEVAATLRAVLDDRRSTRAA